MRVVSLVVDPPEFSGKAGVEAVGLAVDDEGPLAAQFNVCTTIRYLDFHSPVRGWGWGSARLGLGVWVRLGVVRWGPGSRRSFRDRTGSASRRRRPEG